MGILSSYRVRAGKTLRLARFDPAGKPCSLGSKRADQQRLRDMSGQIDALQELLYANRKRSLLIVLQGTDTSGKDGTVRSVFSQVSPLGIRVASFVAPTPEEKSHDFLWRVHSQAPRAGEIVIFNRSHYEDVLITRVKGWIDDAEVERRLKHINNFERLLADSGTVLLKCFLHISKDEQKKRLEARLGDPAKNWKFDPADLVERQSWDEYRRAYETALAATSNKHAPWYVVPADSKTHRNLMVSELVLDTLRSMKLGPPRADPALDDVVVD